MGWCRNQSGISVHTPPIDKVHVYSRPFLIFVIARVPLAQLVSDSCWSVHHCFPSGSQTRCVQEMSICVCQGL